MNVGAALRVHLADELAAGREFESLLKAERDALLCGDADALPELARHKVELARRISELGAMRREKSAGVARTEFARLRGELKECARSIRDLTQHNEALLGLRLQQVNAALSILLAQGSSAPEVYSPDGLARSGHSPRPRAIA